MGIYTSFDYLCNESFYIDGIGNIKSPTLREIRKTTYYIFFCYINFLLCSPQNYAQAIELGKEYEALSEEDKEKNSLYNLLLYNDANLLLTLISFFVCDDVEFDNNSLSFKIYQNVKDGKQCIGHIGNDNFEQFRTEVQNILGLKSEKKQEPKFKNNLAKKMFEKLKKHNQKQEKEQDENYSLDNMIRKYCTHNKVGINILNVWDMTYYQFITMFNEYCNGRQCDFNDMMAANTFVYKKSTDYKPLDYMKKLNND